MTDPPDFATLTAFKVALITPNERNVKAMHRATRTLTSTEILAIHATPLVMVPAPGPGRTIVPISALSTIHPGGTPYANGSDIDLNLGPAAETNLGHAARAALVNNATEIVDNPYTLTDALNNDDRAAVDNQPLTLQALGAAFINGDGTLTVSVAYYIALNV